MKSGFGFADYLLYLDRKAAGRGRSEGRGHAHWRRSAIRQIRRRPARQPAGASPSAALPLRVERLGHLSSPTASTRSRAAERCSASRAPRRSPNGSTSPRPLRARLKELPPLDETGLWKVQAQAITNLEASLAEADPRALIQMATGSGKTFTAVNAAYRLLKFGGAKRILFLVDRGNLGKQTEDEFANFTPPDDTRKFPTLYTVQRLKSNSINPAAKVVITTIQRLYSMLKGEVEFDAENEEGSGFDTAKPWKGEPPDVVYNAGIPPEFFDFVIVDECHRSIYELWAQVLLYFDSFLDRPHRHARRQDHRLLQQEPRHAVRPRRGRHRRRQRRLRRLPHPHAHHRRRRDHRRRSDRRLCGQAPQAHPRRAPRKAARKTSPTPPTNSTATSSPRDQIRTVIREFRDKVLPDAFPGRTEVPKTLIFAKDDSHADDIVRMVRDEFAEKNEFCEKITYRTGFTRVTKKVKNDDGTESRSHRVGEDLQPLARRDSLQLPQQLLPAHRRHRGHDLHRHRREAHRVRLLHAQREVRRLLRADERARRAHHLAGQAQGRHPQRQGQGALHHRGCRGRLRAGQDRLPHAQPQALRDAARAARIRRPGRHRSRRPHHARRTPRAPAARVLRRPARRAARPRRRQIASPISRAT